MFVICCLQLNQKEAKIIQVEEIVNKMMDEYTVATQEVIQYGIQSVKNLSYAALMTNYMQYFND